MPRKREKVNIGIVVSEYNFDITMSMLERAKAHAEFLGADVVEVVMVPGVFDAPIAVKHLVQRPNIDGVVVLGAVIKGETDHDEVIMQHATRKVMDIGIETMKPVALGITGPGMTRLQAQDRIDNAKGAVESVIKLLKVLKKR
jgi:6,7-dimethyl-8-ribityllumazine synthase